MADDSRFVITSEPTVGPEEVAGKGFNTAFRGFDPSEVRAFLQRVSAELAAARERERELRRRLDDIERHPPTPPLDEAMLTAALGEETARVLRSAHEASAEISAKAEQKVARLVRDSQEEAGRLRAEAEAVLARRVEEADELAAGVRRAAESDAEAIRARAHAEAEAILQEARNHGREMVTEAHALRERLLGDLARRRKLAHAQVEQLRAGRERLLDAYRIVRRTLDEVTDELQSAETEARAAAEAAGRRIAAENDLSIDELEAAATAEALDAGPAPEPAPPAVASETVADAPAAVTPPPPNEPPPTESPATTAPLEPSERRSSSLRILRRARSEPRPREAAAEPVVPAVTGDAVRVLPIEPVVDEPPEVVAREVAEPEVFEEPEPEVAAAAGTDIDELFARIRADRAEAVAKAEAVLAAEDGTAAAAAETAESEPEAAPAPDDVAEPEPVTVGDGDEAALQRRDELLEPVDTALVRRLKRLLQDDQNSVLDALRTTKGRPTAAAVLPDEAAHLMPFREVASSLLLQAAEAGSLFASGGIGTGSDVDDLAVGLAQDLVLPLRERLARAVEESDDGREDNGDGPTDTGDVADRVNAAYREWKMQRIEALARHAVVTAFSRAGFAATDDGVRSRWVVDDEGGPCPDCDDDALAGALPKGEPFPTGQLHPPAHPGCRCLLLPLLQ